MPNWVDVRLTVTGDAHDIESFVRRAEAQLPQYKLSQVERRLYGKSADDPQPTVPLSFSVFVPVPQNILDQGYDQAGFDWERENWGIKWGACNTERERPSPWVARYVFRTPWSPPRKTMPIISAQHPSLRFEMEACSWKSDVVLIATYVAGRETVHTHLTGGKSTKEWYRDHRPDEYQDVWGDQS